MNSNRSKIFIETYGCQMNFSDSEIVASVLSSHDRTICDHASEADIILINTCSIRDHAEKKVIARIKQLQSLRKTKPSLIIGVIGCMAERLKEKFFDGIKGVDLLAGPDSYRLLPEMLDELKLEGPSVNVLLSEEETYADISPVRYSSNGVSAFISIMRGCQNFCSYCVVPYTRGKERSRDPQTILDEVKALSIKGYREVTLLGQNVNSYKWVSGNDKFVFYNLLESVALVDPQMRIRFATSHPKDLTDELIHVMASHKNICNSIHLPVQSGSDAILKRMNRKYTSDWYFNRVKAILKEIPEIGISTDIIAGFCGETDQDHKQTLHLMQEVEYSYAYMFKYSERPGTHAADHFADDVPEEIKSERLKEIIALQQQLSLKCNRKDIGKVMEVLVEGNSKKSQHELFGRTTTNKVVVFKSNQNQPGEYVNVRIEKCTSATLIGVIVE